MKSFCIAAALSMFAGVAAATDQYYMVCNTGSKYIMLFDKTDGTVINDQWIDLYNAGSSFGTIKDAIQVLDEIWISDQSSLGSIYRFTADKTNPSYISTITLPTGGNIRGMAFDGTTVYVTQNPTLAGGGRAPRVVMLDRTGQQVGSFVPPAGTSSSGSSPFDALIAGNEVWVSEFFNDNVLRFQKDGTYIGEIVTKAPVAGMRVPEQIAFNNAGDLTVAGFSLPAGIYVYNPVSGAQLNYWYVGGVAGIAQLGDGRYMCTDGIGVKAYDPANGTNIRIYGGAASSSSEYINMVDFDATGCPADFNGDGFLDFTDFDDFVGAFEGGLPTADFNNDGFLDFTDFDAFVGAFEGGC